MGLKTIQTLFVFSPSDTTYPPSEIINGKNKNKQNINFGIVIKKKRKSREREREDCENKEEVELGRG